MTARSRRLPPPPAVQVAQSGAALGRMGSGLQSASASCALLRGKPGTASPRQVWLGGLGWLVWPEWTRFIFFCLEGRQLLPRAERGCCASPHRYPCLLWMPSPACTHHHLQQPACPASLHVARP